MQMSAAVCDYSWCWSRLWLFVSADSSVEPWCVYSDRDMLEGPSITVDNSGRGSSKAAAAAVKSRQGIGEGMGTPQLVRGYCVYGAKPARRGEGGGDGGVGADGGEWQY